MYSWKRIRVICAILLLMPIVHVVYLISSSTMDTMALTPEVWRQEVEAFNDAYSQAPVPDNPIVVVGGKRVKLWDDLPETLAPRPVFMRGIGDAIIEDIEYFYEPLIGYYQPDTVVFLPSSSEFFLRDNKSAESFLQAVKSLLAKDAYHQITRRFYIFTPIKTPWRPDDENAIEQTSSLLVKWGATQENVVVLDANRLLSDPEGKPRPRFFRPDGNNLNEHGYLRLSLLLLTEIEQDENAVDLVELSL